MNLVLTRYGSIPGHGTPGELVIAGLIRCHTIEQIWQDNKPFVSCVPDGEYQLVPHNSDKYGATWALVNPDLGVAHYPTSGIARYACLFHSANWAHQLQGCIAPGNEIAAAVDTRHTSESRLMVTQSRRTLQRMLDILSDEQEHTLQIRWKTYRRS